MTTKTIYEAPPIQTLTEHDLSEPYVGSLSVTNANGRIFLAFKEPGEGRVTFFEFLPGTWGLHRLGEQPGIFYKDGDGGVACDAAGKLYYFTTSSPDPTTGAGARVVVSDEVAVVNVGKIMTQTAVRDEGYERLGLPASGWYQEVQAIITAELKKYKLIP